MTSRNMLNLHSAKNGKYLNDTICVTWQHSFVCDIIDIFVCYRQLCMLKRSSLSLSVSLSVSLLSLCLSSLYLSLTFFINFILFIFLHAKYHNTLYCTIFWQLLFCSLFIILLLFPVKYFFYQFFLSMASFSFWFLANYFKYIWQVSFGSLAFQIHVFSTWVYVLFYSHYALHFLSYIQ